MLRPCPNVGPNSAKYSFSRGAVSVVATDRSSPPMKMPIADGNHSVADANEPRRQLARARGNA